MTDLKNNLFIPAFNDELQATIEASDQCLVMVNGKCSFKLSNIPDGINVWDSSNLEGDMLESFVNTFESVPKKPLNSATFIEFNKSLNLYDPLYVYFLVNDNKVESPVVRNFFLLQEGVEITIIEKHISSDMITEASKKEMVSEWAIGANAKLNHYVIEDPNKSPDVEINNSIIIQQLKNSYCSFFTFYYEDGITNNKVEVLLSEEFATCNLYSISILNNSAIVNHDVKMNHNSPNCESTQIYKGIFNGSSSGEFNSVVFVKKDAQQTSSVQQNNNIILSDYVSVRSNPQLEIFADDVKCAHGSTIGQIDYNALFYLRSRGVGKELATSILLQGFLNDVVQEMNILEVKKPILMEIAKHLGLNDNFKDTYE